MFKKASLILVSKTLDIDIDYGIVILMLFTVVLDARY
jgi:hypothetical protein